MYEGMAVYRPTATVQGLPQQGFAEEEDGGGDDRRPANVAVKVPTGILGDHSERGV